MRMSRTVCILWYASDMSTARITVTLPLEQVRQIRQSTDNLSGFVADAVANHLRWQLVRQDLEDYQAEHGAFTDEEVRTAEEDMTPYLPSAQLAA